MRNRASRKDKNRTGNLGQISQLPPWVRGVALLAGSTGGVAGVWATFVSDNQAGSAVAILASLGLLLVGLQGTPILRIGTTDASLELGEARLTPTIAGEAEEQRAGVAAEQAADALPSATTAHTHATDYYTEAVIDALERVSWSPVEHAPQAFGADAIAYCRYGRPIGVLIRNIDNTPFRSYTVLMEIEAVVVQAGVEGIVLVTSAPVSKEVTELFHQKCSVDVQVVNWMNQDDDELLREAISSIES